MVEFKTKEEVLKAYNEYIVGKVFNTYQDLHCAFAMYIGVNDACYWLLSEYQQKQIEDFYWAIDNFDVAVDSAFRNISENIYTMRNDECDRDVLCRSYENNERKYLLDLVYDLRCAMLTEKALNDGAKIEYTFADNPDYDEKNECDLPCIKVLNEHYKGS